MTGDASEMSSFLPAFVASQGALGIGRHRSASEVDGQDTGSISTDMDELQTVDYFAMVSRDYDDIEQCLGFDIFTT